MQARARTVGRGGALFRGTLEKLRLGQRWRLRAAPPNSGLTGHVAPDHPAQVASRELDHARSEIARQSVLLADLIAQAETAKSEARELARSRTQLLAALNHDLRTPLNAVIGFSDVMQRELFGPLGHDRYRDYAVHIRESGEQLLKATEQMLGHGALSKD